MTRRALAEATLVLLIIALISSGVIGLFVYNYSKAQDCAGKVELCRTSFFILSSSKKTLGLASKVLQDFKIDCPICVPGSSDEIKVNTPNEAMREIAEHLKYCWYKTLGDEIKSGVSTVAINNFCLVCSEFNVNKDISNQDLLNYLKTTKINSGVGKGKIYADYFDFTDYRIKSENIVANKKMQVIKFIRGGDIVLGEFAQGIVGLNQLMIVDNAKVSELPCTTYHYQKE